MIYNPLKRVWIVYQASRDALKVTKQAISHDDKKTLLFRTTFESQNSTEAKQIIEESLKELEDLLVLSLWSTYERFVRIYLQQKGATLQTTKPAILASPIYEYFCDEVEFWKSYQILDLLKKSVFTTNSHIIGQAKQILTYRDWVAHGKNPNKLPSSNITARFAYKVLNQIVEILLFN
jgi:hydrogenase maturation factor